MALFLITILMLLSLISIPYFRYPSSTGGVWFASVRGRRSARDAAVFALIATPIGILLDEYVADFTAWMPDLSPVISNGVVPFMIILFVFCMAYLFLKRRYDVNKNESLQMVFVFFLTAFIILTVTGIWFRGTGMRLVWPWV